MIWKGIKQMIPETVRIPGSVAQSDSDFKFQSVTRNSKIVVLDDLMEGFNFREYFPYVTDQLYINKKHQDAFTIEVKFLFTTNMAIPDFGNSFTRRKFEVEFAQYYNPKFQPKDEFNCLFYKWESNVEWDRFYNTMIYCSQLFHKHGLHEYTQKNLWKNKIITATCYEFVEFIEGLIENNEIADRAEKTAKELYNDFQVRYPGIIKHQRKLTEWITANIESFGFKLSTVRCKGNRGKKIIFTDIRPKKSSSMLNNRTKLKAPDYE